MSDCGVKIWDMGRGASSGASVLNPTQEDQIPVSRANPVTGAFEYAPKTNPLKDIDPVTDAGKGLVVASGGGGNDVVLESADLVFGDDAVDSLLDQTGVITNPDITVINTTTIRITNYRVHFYIQATDERVVLNIGQEDIPITAAGNPGSGIDYTYVILEETGNYVQSNTPPTKQQLTSELFVCEVSHPDGGDIDAVRSLFTHYGNIIAQQRDVYDALGVRAKGFELSFNYSDGKLSQIGNSATLNGYNIAATGTDRNAITFPAADVNAEYYSYNPADRVTTINDWRRTYNIDDVAAGTSAAIGNNDFGIVVLYASVSGKYLALAPQKEYTNFDNANAERVVYASTVVLPEQFRAFYQPIATIIVDPTVSSTTTDTFDVELLGDVAFNGGGFASQRALPDPASGNPNDVVTVDPTTSTYVLASNGIPDLNSAPPNSFLAVENNAYVFKEITSADVTGFLFGAANTWKFAKFEINNGVIENGSGDFSIIQPLFSNVTANGIGFTTSFGNSIIMPCSISVSVAGGENNYGTSVKGSINFTNNINLTNGNYTAFFLYVVGASI